MIKKCVFVLSLSVWGSVKILRNISAPQDTFHVAIMVQQRLLGCSHESVIQTYQGKSFYTQLVFPC